MFSSRAPLLTAMAMLLASCTVTTDGHPVASTPLGSPPYDACTAIPDDVITALDADPGSKAPYANPTANRESGCRWSSTERVSSGIISAYAIEVGSVPDAPSAYLTSRQFTSTETSVGGRQVVNFTPNTAENLCNLAVAIDGGSAIIAVIPALPQKTRDETCGIASNVATAIAPTLP